MKKETDILDSCDPRQCISMKMLKCNRIISQIFREHLKEFGITNSQLTVLFIASKREYLNQAMLSEMLYLEKSTISRNMKRLFDKEFISREEFPQLKITEKGKEFLRLVIPKWNSAMEEAKAKLKEEGLQSLDSLLYQLEN
ncbi:MarR family transcriptional regulator [Leptobacterium flavescens]|uniref:MarR family transcriptional regulator n=1 Tax=Leptobacterium flavescens TaxID=472055 RepID=A0A6P0UXP0_9FLAO|nr:MarR family transcriptional regulator [Leptobacterium flavescens]NER15226.1 MarR family transcriptional regulator [Leptobacterium flavescens]